MTVDLDGSVGRGNGTRAEPRCQGRGLAAGMCELRPPHCAAIVTELRDTAKPVDMLVVPYPEIVRRDTAAGGNGDRFGQHERRAADRAAAEMDDVPVVRKAVDRRVFAHR